jgi:hypothetical protein
MNNVVPFSHKPNVVHFSDHVIKKLGGKLLATADVGADDDGNPVINADMGPLEVSVYTSHNDGALVVQIDYPETITQPGEESSLRVYFNNTTLYPETTTQDSDEESNTEGEN